MIRCVIIDDEPPAIKVIKKHMSKLPQLQLAGEATNPLKGLEIIKEEKPDVVFLDIQMDEMCGLEVMKIIGKDVLVVFCTAYSEFAVTSYDLDAVDYLMKPIEFNRFALAVQRVTNILAAQPSVYDEAIPNDYFFVKAGLRGKLIKIDIDEIDVVEARDNYMAFHCGPLITLAYLTMKEVEERLPSNQFIRVHKSYMVAIKQISLMENNELVLKKCQQRIPIGASYKELFLERMKNKLIS